MSAGREAFDLHNPACRTNAKRLLKACWNTTKTRNLWWAAKQIISDTWNNVCPPRIVKAIDDPKEPTEEEERKFFAKLAVKEIGDTQTPLTDSVEYSPGCVHASHCRVIEGRLYIAVEALEELHKATCSLPSTLRSCEATQRALKVISNARKPL